MAFIENAVGIWLVEELADKTAKKISAFVLGTAQESALRHVGREAVESTSRELMPQEPDRLAQAISGLFEYPREEGDEVDEETTLESLCAAIQVTVAALDDPALSGIGQSFLHAVGISSDVLSETLVKNLLSGIRSRGLAGGPLEPLWRQLNDDVTHLQMEEHRLAGIRIDATLSEVLSELHIQGTFLAQLFGPGSAPRLRQKTRTSRRVATDSAGRLPPPRQLRQPPADFTGRDADLQDLMRAHDAGMRVFLIRGMPGIGKTTLARRFAEQLAEQYDQGHIEVDLQGMTSALDPPQVARHVMRSLHVDSFEADDEQALLADYRSVLGSTRALFLFDNAAGEAQVAPLLPPRSCVTIITCRSSFSLPGMHSLRLRELGPKESAVLLIRIAPRLARKLSDQQATEDIARLCGNLPLALRHAGGLLNDLEDLDPQIYAGRLKDERVRLSLLAHETMDPSVEAAFQLSYDGLHADTASALRALSAFPASFDLVAAIRVTGEEGGDRVGTLVRRGLVEYESEAGRYRLHDLVRVFVANRLGEAEEAAARLRHSEHFLFVLLGCLERFRGGGPQEEMALRTFDIERSNIQAGQAWAAGQAATGVQPARLTAQYPIAGRYLLLLRLAASEHERWLREGLTAAQSLQDSELEKLLWNDLGISLKNMGRHREAIDCYARGLQIQSRPGAEESTVEADLLNNLGLAKLYVGALDESRRAFDLALKLYRTAGKKHLESMCLTNKGRVLIASEQYEEAELCLREGLAAAEESEFTRGIGDALLYLGRLAKIGGNPAEAIASLEPAVEAFRVLKDQTGLVAVLTELGDVVYSVGRSDLAAPHFREAWTLARRTGNRREQVTALRGLAQSLWDGGHPDEAVLKGYQVADLLSLLGDPDSLMWRAQVDRWHASIS